MHQVTKLLISYIVIFLISLTIMQTRVFAFLDAQYISDNIPSEMHPGERRKLSVIMENTGDEPWVGTGFRLQSISDPEDTWSFTSSYIIDDGIITYPGQQKDFVLYLDSPLTPGTYESKWQMRDASTNTFFGDDILLDSIWVDESVIPEWDASITTHTLPSELYPGEPRLVSVTVQNTGVGDWSGDRYALSANKNEPIRLWNTVYNHSLGEEETVSPGEQRTFTFLISAPLEEDIYDCTWQMIHIHAFSFFGELLSEPLNVSTSAPPQLGSIMIGNTIPANMEPGETRSATITLENTGTVTWNDNNVRFHTPNNTWGPNRNYYLETGETVVQGEQKTFTISITAPAVENTYNCEWQMQGYFNEVNQNRSFGDVLDIPLSVGSTPCTDHFDCGSCQKCEAGYCVPQTTSEDLKNECPDEICTTGFCDGTEGCAFEPSTSLCRPIADICDSEEYCTGSSATCPPDQFLPDGTPCNDGTFCNGSETCELGTCYSGDDPCAPPLVCDEPSATCLGCTSDIDCNDFITCTVDSCEPNGTCLNTPDNFFCDDGLYCNGTEICEPLSDCQAGANPCPGQSCEEITDQCDSTLPPEPTFLSLQPDSGSSVLDSPLTFTLAVGDGDGAQDITTAKMVIKEGVGTGTTADSIVLEYRSYRPNRIYMYNHIDGRWIFGVLGTANVLEDSLASVELSQSGISEVGEILTLTINLTPKAPFIELPLSENKRIWLLLRDAAGNSVNNIEIGSWVVSDSCSNDSDCDDGVFCNGFELCTGGSCQPGSTPCNPPLLCNESIQTCVECITDADCNDGISCTLDSCESDATCMSRPTDSFCDDGLFCNGTETCDYISDCQVGSDPCPTLLCDDVIDLCVDCLTGLDCDDGIDCTYDSCEPDGTCWNTPNDLFCDDGLYCNGTERCDPLFDCQTGSDPCPAQLCDDTIDLCVDCLTGLDCDDGVFCNGSETCEFGICYLGEDPCPPPMVCDEIAGACLGCTFDSDCDDGINCTLDSCDPNGSCLNTLDDLFCDDGLYCNGLETCDSLFDCQAGSDPCPAQLCDDTIDLCVDCLTDIDCDDGIDCTLDSCEPDGSCLNTPDDLFCDDGLFCNGAETCDPLSDCQPGSDPCHGQSCDEATDQCDATLPPEPTFISLQPDSESSVLDSPVTFTLTVGDGDGFQDLNTVKMVIKEGVGTGTTSDSIVLEYRLYRPDRIYMYNHIDGRWTYGVLGTSAVIEDNLSSIDLGQSSSTGVGELLTLTITLTPKTPFIEPPLSENKRIWLLLRDTDNNTVNHLEIGAWTVF